MAGTSARLVVSRRVDFPPREPAHGVEVRARADAVIAISNAVAAALRNAGVPQERVHIVPSGIELPSEPRSRSRAGRSGPRHPGRRSAGSNNPKTRAIDVDNEKAPLVRKAFELLRDFGEYTLKSVAIILDQAGLRSYKGNVLSVSCVQRMLQNQIYYGVFSFNGEIYDGTHEPIISKKLLILFNKRCPIGARRNASENTNLLFRG